MSKKLNWYNLITLLIMCVSVLIIVFFGFQKKGFYVDEYYTYTDANGTGNGVPAEVGQWNDTSLYVSQLVADEGDSFGQLIVNTSNNVHPPAYYILIKLASMLVPGVFSKWIGICVNILLFLIGIILFRECVFTVSKDKVLSLTSVAFFAISPAMISGVLLVRMYLLFALFALGMLLVVLKDIERDAISVTKTIVPGFIIGFCGFMTQYYFVIYLFAITFVYCFNLMFFRKRIRDCFIFGITELVALIATYFVWPYSIFHIFKDYRGTGSMEDLVYIGSAIIDRIINFISIMDKGLFGGFLVLVILCAFVGIFYFAKDFKENFTVLISEKCQKHTEMASIILISLVAIPYYGVITKIGLMAQEASSRYVYPVFALLIILAIEAIYFVAKQVSEILPVKVLKKESAKYVITGMICLLFLLGAYCRNQVLYLYPEEETLKEFELARPDAQFVIFENDDGVYDQRIQDFIRYDRVFFALCDEPEKVINANLDVEKPVLIYTDNRFKEDECLKALHEAYPELGEETLVFETSGRFNVYCIE